jgi:hypothetical protein
VGCGAGFFRAAAGGGGRRPGTASDEGRAVGLGPIFAELIAAGHVREDIPRMTRRQIELYLREARTWVGVRRAAFIIDVGAAVWGGSQAQELVDSLLGRGTSDNR